MLRLSPRFFESALMCGGGMPATVEAIKFRMEQQGLTGSVGSTG